MTLNVALFLLSSLACLVAALFSLRCSIVSGTWRNMHLWTAIVAGYISGVYLIGALMLAGFMEPTATLRSGVLSAVGTALLALIVVFTIIAQGCKYGRK